VTPAKPAEHAIIIVDGLLTVWDKPDLGFHGVTVRVAPGAQFEPLLAGCARAHVAQDQGAARMSRPDAALCAPAATVVERGTDHDARLAAVSGLVQFAPAICQPEGGEFETCLPTETIRRRTLRNFRLTGRQRGICWK
jgi:hypothetical protein